MPVRSELAGKERQVPFDRVVAHLEILGKGLVAVPVKAYPATSTTETVRFNQLHAGCGQRIRYEKHCPSHGKVEAAEIVKGYPYAPDQYVVVEDSELDRLRPPKEKALLLEQFVDAGQVEPVRLSGRTLYLFPDGLPAQRSYLLLAEAMQTRHCSAVGRITISGRRHGVVVRPLGRLLAMHVLHDAALVRPTAPLEAELRQGASSPEELNLACTLIDSASGPLDWFRLRDDTPEKLAQLIEAKLEGREVGPFQEEPVQVLQLLDALKQSVAQAAGNGAGKKASSGVKNRSRKRRTA
ncbi:MAG: Ku protein [Planctomycetota bacterium]